MSDTQIIYLGHLLILTCSILTQRGKVEQSQPDRGKGTRGSDLLVMRVQILLSKHGKSWKVLPESQSQLEWVLGRGGDGWRSVLGPPIVAL